MLKNIKCGRDLVEIFGREKGRIMKGNHGKNKM